MSKPQAKRRYRRRRLVRKLDRMLDQIEAFLGWPDGGSFAIDFHGKISRSFLTGQGEFPMPDFGAPIVRLEPPSPFEPAKRLTLDEAMVLLASFTCMHYDAAGGTCGKPGGLLCEEHNPF